MPAIRTPAMETPIQTPSAVPSNLGGQMGALALNQPLQDPQSQASITGGAPSMTAMLGATPSAFSLGTPSSFNMFDPRATQSPSLTMRTPRLA
jgi:hypothetical protein